MASTGHELMDLYYADRNYANMSLESKNFDLDVED